MVDKKVKKQITIGTYYGNGSFDLPEFDTSQTAENLLIDLIENSDLFSKVDTFGIMIEYPNGKVKSFYPFSWEDGELKIDKKEYDEAKYSDNYYIFTFLLRDMKKRDAYVKAYGNIKTAREKMIKKYNLEWGFQYESEEDAGVKDYNLRLKEVLI